MAGSEKCLGSGLRSHRTHLAPSSCPEEVGQICVQLCLTSMANDRQNSLGSYLRLRACTYRPAGTNSDGRRCFSCGHRMTLVREGATSCQPHYFILSILNWSSNEMGHPQKFIRNKKCNSLFLAPPDLDLSIPRMPTGGQNRLRGVCIDTQHSVCMPAFPIRLLLCTNHLQNLHHRDPVQHT